MKWKQKKKLGDEKSSDNGKFYILLHRGYYVRNVLPYCPDNIEWTLSGHGIPMDDIMASENFYGLKNEFKEFGTYPRLRELYISGKFEPNTTLTVKYENIKRVV